VAPTYIEEYAGECGFWVHGDDGVHDAAPPHSNNCGGRAWPSRATCVWRRQRLGPAWLMGSLLGLPFCTS